jgi:3-methyladenine DNA glycosylase AlkD
MNSSEILKKLKAAGTAQNRKIYARHGVSREMFGVSYKVLGELTKKIKIDHAIALDLWASGNHDAMVLACMVANPQQMTANMINAWAKELDSGVLNGAFVGLVKQTPGAFKKANTWMRSNTEGTASLGWNLLAALALLEIDEDFEPYIARIESDIHGAKNRVRYSMNGALIAIGIYNSHLHKKALAAAKRIGVVEVDHGETGCKTPDAASYMAKSWEHKNRKKKKKSGTAS